MRFHTFVALKSFLFVICFVQSAISHASTLDDIIERDEIICGVKGGSFGFGKVDDNGQWSGFDVDFCQALAAAVLKDYKKVDYIPLSNSVRFKALQNNEIDVLIRNTTWTLTRDTKMGLEFSGVNFYDGQGFIAWKQPGKTKLSDYPPDTKICMIKNTTSLVNLYDYLEKHNMKFTVLEFTSTEAAENKFLARDCDLHSRDRSLLASIKGESVSISNQLIILDDIISKEPLGLVIRNDDRQWQEIVQWVLFATFEAEERGITQQNIDDIVAETKDPAIRFFLGVDPGVGEGFGLDDKWAYRIIKQVGNYGEIYDRNMGPNSKLRIERGLNKLWKDGGLHYSPPFR